MWLDLLLFILLAVLTNSVLPLSFDPVLIYFASRHSLDVACDLALAGSVCAGLAGLADVKLLGLARQKISPTWASWLPRLSGRWFYFWAFWFALLPLPFTVIRLAILRQPPRAAPYALVVGLGRLPRYLLTVYFWQSLALPPWVNPVILLLAVVFACYKLIVKRWSPAER